MFIETEHTPNPATLKFIPGQDLVPLGTVECNTLADAQQKSPLAEKLFAVPGVVSVFLGKTFVTVTKEPEYHWEDLKAEITISMVEHLMAGDPIVTEAANSDDDHNTHDGEHGEVINQIKELLDLRVRPAVARDGGDIIFDSFVDGIVYLTMRGSCAGCPSSTATLKMGIENMLRHYIPEVEEVRAVEDLSPLNGNMDDEEDDDDDESHIQY